MQRYKKLSNNAKKYIEMGNYERKNTGDAFGVLIAIAMALVFCLMISICCGCKTKYIASEPVIVHERDSIYKVNTLQVHDTLIYRDSVFHLIKGDTILIERWHNMQSINHVARVDTIVKVDEKEIPVPYPKPYAVEKELSWWQKTCITLGKIALFVLVIFMGWNVYKVYRKFKI